MAIGAITQAWDDAKSAASSVYHAATGAADRVASGGESLVKGAVSDVSDTVDSDIHFGEDVGKGIGDWGVGTWDTVKTLVEHPIESAEAVGKLATNPVLNPLVAQFDVGKNLIEGNDPLKDEKTGAQQLIGLGKAIAGDYINEYKKNGAGGVAGYVLPDLALAVLTDGGDEAAKAAGEVAGDAAKAGLKDTVRGGLSRATEATKQAGSKQVEKVTDSTVARLLKTTEGAGVAFEDLSKVGVLRELGGKLAGGLAPGKTDIIKIQQAQSAKTEPQTAKSPHKDAT